MIDIPVDATPYQYAPIVGKKIDCGTEKPNLKFNGSRQV